MTDNGILARIPGQFVSAATQNLPDAGTSKMDVMETEFDVPEIGRVHFTAQRTKAKRGKHSHYFWAVSCARLVG